MCLAREAEKVGFPFPDAGNYGLVWLELPTTHTNGDVSNDIVYMMWNSGEVWSGTKLWQLSANLCVILHYGGDYQGKFKSVRHSNLRVQGYGKRQAYGTKRSRR